ncbi:hypothetical protein [Neisseria sp.]|uniref:hypothetical protein n=1 Tax=Neisseria sp. TaxID=192066 RepID=UPI00359FE421
MVNQVLNPQSERELAAVGFAKAELDRIKANDLLVQQVNQFAARGGNFGKSKQGAFYYKGDIFFQKNSPYTNTQTAALTNFKVNDRERSIQVLYYQNILRPSERNIRIFR